MRTNGLAIDQRATPGQIIKSLAPGEFVKLCRVAEGGSLEARKLAAGTQFYWRYTSEGKTDRLPIGFYDPTASPKSTEKSEHGFSVLAAEREAERMAKEHRKAAEVGGLRGVKRAETQARIAARDQTLDKLMTDYCEHLKALGRRSYRDAQSIFKIHVREAWPDKAKRPAAKVTTEDVADMMRKAIEAGKGRTANKLRSYLRAAFQTAKASRTKPSIPVHFKDFGVTFNPAAETEPDETKNVPDKRPLSRDELRTYWRLIKRAPGIRGSLLRLHLLTGGQRIEQLVNLRTENVEPAMITLYDGKGRPGHPPRPHAIPLTKSAKLALKECEPQKAFALSTDGGESHIAATTLSTWAAEAVGDAITDFQAKRIRSGVETLLASLGVSSDVRGRLQSHGVSGVQARHYDGHLYLDEKRAALTLLEKSLTAR
jgi:integrase